MRFLLLSLIIGLLALCASAVAPQKAVIFTYPDNTPSHVMDDAKKALQDAGGVITHEYKLIKGFAAKASAKALDTVSALATDFKPYIEEDQIVAIDGDIVEGGHLRRE